MSLHIWDTAGQEEFSKLTRNYYAGAKACVIAFSTTDRDSFLAVRKWKEQAQATIPDDIAWALVQNKCDLMQDGSAETTPEEAEQLATELGVRFYRMSVKENMMVDDVFKYLAESAYDIMRRPKAPAAASAGRARPARRAVGPSLSVGRRGGPVRGGGGRRPKHGRQSRWQRRGRYGAARVQGVDQSADQRRRLGPRKPLLARTRATKEIILKSICSC